MNASRTIAAIIGLTLVGLAEIGPAAGDAGAAVPQNSQKTDREAWARKLAALNGADWRTAFAVGQGLAALPADEGFAILEANWGKVRDVRARHQLLKAWYVVMPFPLHLRLHPRLLDGLDLGMRDQSPEVQKTALAYLGGLAFRDFSEDRRAYADWYRANRDRPVAEVVIGSIRRFAAESARAVKSDAQERAVWLRELRITFDDVPEARRATLDAGLLRTLGRWAAGADAGSSDEEIRLALGALTAIGGLGASEADLRRVVVPLIDKKKPAEVGAAAIAALEGKDNAWAKDLVLDALREGLGEEDRSRRMNLMRAAADALGSYEDPRVIPALIAVMEAHPSRQANYDVGYFGLSRMTGVPYDQTHDGAWWRRWWEENKGKSLRAIRASGAPEPAREPPARPAPDDALADVADVPSRDLRAEGDERKRYFLIGAGKAAPPAGGYGLLIVLPGGDGSADFHPFIRRIYKNVLKDRWLVAQAVAPKWDDTQFDQVVWPTASLPYPSARFTTEDFIRAIVADVRAKEKIDPRRVFLLGWSSGGPPCYAMATRPDSGIAGAFIAMSVFRPDELPTIEAARGRAFYLLQSPEDQITPMRFAEAAERALQAAGAKVRLRRYEGGHGWHGDIWSMIAEGIAWLNQQAGGE